MNHLSVQNFLFLLLLYLDSLHSLVTCSCPTLAVFSHPFYNLKSFLLWLTPVALYSPTNNFILVPSQSITCIYLQFPAFPVLLLFTDSWCLFHVIQSAVFHTCLCSSFCCPIHPVNVELHIHFRLFLEHVPFQLQHVPLRWTNLFYRSTLVPPGAKCTNTMKY